MSTEDTGTAAPPPAPEAAAQPQVEEPGLAVSYAGALEEVRARLDQVEAEAKAARTVANGADGRAFVAQRRAEEAAEGPSLARTVVSALVWTGVTFVVGMALTKLATSLMPSEPVPTLRRLDEEERAAP
jgi:hypothetical protein